MFFIATSGHNTLLATSIRLELFSIIKQKIKKKKIVQLHLIRKFYQNVFFKDNNEDKCDYHMIEWTICDSSWILS